MRFKPKNRITKMTLDEISLVPSGDDPMAEVIIAKTAPDSSVAVDDEKEDEKPTSAIEDDKKRTNMRKRSARSPRRGHKNNLMKSEALGDDEDPSTLTIASQEHQHKENHMPEGNIDKSSLTDEQLAYVEEIEGALDAVFDDLESGALVKSDQVDTSENSVLAKAAPEVQEYISKQDERIAKMERREAERDVIEKIETSYSSLNISKSDFSSFLLELGEKAPDLVEKADAILKAANAQAETATAFSEIGKIGAGAATIGEDFDATVAEVVSKSEGKTKEQALEEVLSSNPAAYDEYLAGGAR